MSDDESYRGDVDVSDASAETDSELEDNVVELSLLTDCPLHELRSKQRALGWPHAGLPDVFVDDWARLPHVVDGAVQQPVRRSTVTAHRGRPVRSLSRSVSPRKLRSKPPRKRPRMLPVPPSDSSSDAERPQEPRPNVGLVLSARQNVEERWRRVCAAAGAAPVAIVSANDEQVPPGMVDFEYIEGGYQRQSDVDEGFLVSCTCTHQACENAANCVCQEDFTDESGILRAKTLAYDQNGLFKFDRPYGSLIVECNKNCSCSRRKCPSRVAQRPRTVPIQIFKTQSRGWGVRVGQDLPKGRVLGLYTGKLITRQQAALISGDNKSYIFDLDALEDNGIELPDDKKYSVDAYRQGNWTRFVNHSCEPNVEVYPVVWDTPGSMNQPYLAFVTNQDIPAMVELTIDYDPKAARDKKGKQRQRPGAKECMCGTKSCRGWVAV